jgi:hypothetical protein
LAREKLWHETLRITLKEGTIGRLDAVRKEGEDSLSVIREAITRELKRRERTRPSKTS